MIIGYHASHEQFAPTELLSFVQAAERAGFQAVMTSDHIAPWSVRQGNSGNNWAWLGAALASTSIPFGSLAIPGGWRYHPVVLAHLVGTLAEMYPERLRWIAVGSGEAINETAVGADWPRKIDRDQRLKLGADLVRALLDGETVDHSGLWFSVNNAKLWSLPRMPPAIFGAALTAKTADWMGSWADGLLTVRKPIGELRQLVANFRNSGGQGKPLAIQLQISWGKTTEEARMSAWDQWRCAVVPADQLANLRRPQEFDAITRHITPADMDNSIPLCVCGNDVATLIEQCASCGFDEVYVHSVSRDQMGFMDFMAREVLPHLR